MDASKLAACAKAGSHDYKHACTHDFDQRSGLDIFNIFVPVVLSVTFEICLYSTFYQMGFSIDQQFF